MGILVTHGSAVFGNLAVLLCRSVFGTVKRYPILTPIGVVTVRRGVQPQPVIPSPSTVGARIGASGNRFGNLAVSFAVLL